MCVYIYTYTFVYVYLYIYICVYVYAACRLHVSYMQPACIMYHVYVCMFMDVFMYLCDIVCMSVKQSQAATVCFVTVHFVASA